MPAGRAELQIVFLIWEQNAWQKQVIVLWLVQALHQGRGRQSAARGPIVGEVLSVRQDFSDYQKEYVAEVLMSRAESASARVALTCS